MFINELNLKNFGPIVDLQIRPAGNLVGIFGPNGRGKTHVLHAIKLLMTGITGNEHTLSSFIREGSKFAEIDMRARIFGMDAVLSRRITPTSSTQKFEWDGKTYTRAEPILRLLEEIFDVDRKSIAEIAFLEQGALNTLLFGGDADREALFARILNVDYAKARETLLIKTNTLRKTYKDLSGVMDDYKRQETSAKELLAESESTLKECPKVDPARISELRKSIQVLEDLEAKKSSLNSLHARLADELNNSGKVVDATAMIAATEHYIQLRDSIVGMADGKKSKLQARQRNLENRDLTEKELQQEQLALTPLEEKRSYLGDPENESELYALLQDLRKKIDGVKRRSAAESGLIGKDVIDGLSCQIQEHEKEDEALREKYHDLDVTYKNLSLNVKILKEIQACRKPGEEVCPNCSMKFTADSVVALDSGELEAREVRLKETQRELVSLTGKIDVVAKKLKALREDLAYKRQVNSVHETTLNETQEFRELSLADLVIQRDDVSSRHTKVSDRNSLRTSLDKELSVRREIVFKLKEKLEGIKSDFETLTEEEGPTTLPDIEKELEKLERQKKVAKEEREQQKKKLEDLRSTQEAFIRHNERIETLKRDISTTVREVTAITEQVPEGQKENPAAAKEGLYSSLNSLEEQQQRYTTAKAQFDERYGNWEKIKIKITELKEQIKKDNRVRESVTKLENARELLGRTGLPAVYMRERFEQIAALTQAYLSKFNCGFSVSPSPDRSLAFDVTFHDTGNTRTMFKASGGEKIRITVGYLMAARQLLLPKVGFLTLDEPTTHLDGDGVDALLQLMGGISQTSTGEHSQVWIIDHHPEFRNAVNTSVDFY